VKWRCYESKTPQPKSASGLLTPQGKLVKKFLLPIQLLALEWLPSGSGLFFVGQETATGLRRRRCGAVTHFDSEPANVLAYTWSRDGKKFAITRAPLQGYRRRHVQLVPIVAVPKIERENSLELGSAPATGF